MKLSEAIRLGAMLRPQAFGHLFRDGASCALGAAGEAAGIADIEAGGWAVGAVAPPSWNPIATREADCPVCVHGFLTLRKKHDAHAVIVHLNNDHRWTREQIADWVATIEAQHEAAAPVESLVTVTA